LIRRPIRRWRGCPRRAIVAGSSGAQVAVVGADGKVKLKPVTIGRDFGDSVEILSGLDITDRIVDSPPETIQNGDVVRVSAADAPSSGKPASASSH
jgi:multidrug efflux pump subunit AcrA (membrane-fusion protein)